HGILNLSPDSFSGDGLGDNVESAVKQARRFVAEGADIIDVGGESTRPQAAPISAAEELKRIIPAIERLAGEISVPISVDTYKSEVASRALAAGANIINDIWGLKRDAELARLAAEANAPIILMSNQRDSAVHDIMSQVIFSLKESIALATAAGVARENIIIDPGIGFGKTVEQNLEIMHRLAELKCLGRPILLGTSRKSMIGLVLDLPPEERLQGSLATVAIGIAGGADIVRVHDVGQTVRTARMSDAMVRRR
ncbi:dihydropteroate synthase, partial [Chloroflexota bacterium]